MFLNETRRRRSHRIRKIISLSLHLTSEVEELAKYFGESSSCNLSNAIGLIEESWAAKKSLKSPTRFSEYSTPGERLYHEGLADLARKKQKHENKDQDFPTCQNITSVKSDDPSYGIHSKASRQQMGFRSNTWEIVLALFMTSRKQWYQWARKILGCQSITTIGKRNWKISYCTVYCLIEMKQVAET